MSAGRKLTATYRLQMNAQFTLARARARVDYFAALGISHLYLSPILASRRGSMHGYDVVDPTRLNPELGTGNDLRALSRDLRARDMGLIVDIVPNHMGIGAENRYWDDVLANGEHSRYARWFDIDWTRRDGLHGKLVLPVLGDELDRVIDRGELTIELRDAATPRVVYFDKSFPLDPASLPPELQLAQVDPEEAGELAAAYSGSDGRHRLRALLAAQHYSLVDWRRGPAEINYRRFFDVNDLAAVRVDDPAVFDATHALILRLANDGVVDGVRVDHIDGLLDPRAYLDRLRAALPTSTLIFVEKILSPGEQLRADWPIQGTTGYEFLNALDDVFIDPSGFRELDEDYQQLRHMGESSFEETALDGKRAMLRGTLSADLARVAALLAPLVRAIGKRWPAPDVEAALVEIIVALPVYRTYIAPESPLDPDDRAVIERACAAARARANPEIVAAIGQIILGEAPRADAAARLRFVQRFQQVTGPVTAKGVEDTALYAYLPLASRNEVGGSPARRLAGAVDRLHDANVRRAERWPLGLLATNTHDTKRSADLRSRLDALSEIPNEWVRTVERWRALNDAYRQVVNGRSSPDINTEYLLYQTLIGLWPAHLAGGMLPDDAWRRATSERIRQYLLKASREAKMRTSWVDPDEAYEAELDRFVAAILDPRHDARFLADVAQLAPRVSAIGVRNALSRIAIHLTSPGTPDIYQGDELWNFTLVDPDNRRPVDYDVRANLLAQTASTERLVCDRAIDLADDRVKMLVTHRLLALRRARPDLFAAGTYRALTIRGPRADNVVAFVRSAADRHCITIAPRLMGNRVTTSAADTWKDTAIELPADLAAVAWQSQIVSDSVSSENGVIPLSGILAKLPVAVLAS